MNNEVLFLVSIVLVFGAIVLTNRAFGKAGLFAWAALIPVLANVLTAKQVTIFGIDATLGTILFASVFLCTDIISELYGQEDAKKAAMIGAVAIVGYIVVTQIAVLFDPNEFDYVQGSMETIFSFSLRISVASLICFMLSNMVDVYLFGWLKKKFPKHLWLRNNVATLTCNILENFLMMMGAFCGIYPLRECVMIALATSIIEVIVGLMDTPFAYIARAWHNKDVAE